MLLSLPTSSTYTSNNQYLGMYVSCSFSGLKGLPSTDTSIYVFITDDHKILPSERFLWLNRQNTPFLPDCHTNYKFTNASEARCVLNVRILETNIMEVKNGERIILKCHRAKLAGDYWICVKLIILSL